jgi:hypothetical protein
MRVFAAASLFLLLALRGCTTYEFDHEFWLRVDGTGDVSVTGRPELWAEFKGLRAPLADTKAMGEEARRLFESAGLEVRRVSVTRRGGHPYLFLSARFKDVSKLSGSPAFPDILGLGMAREPGKLRFYGKWVRPGTAPAAAAASGIAGLVAVRVHLPAKVFEHRNAVDGLERGNIVSWRETVAESLVGQPLEFGFLIGDRSILLSTVGLFAGAIILGLGLLGLALYMTARRGRKKPADMIGNK